MKKLLIVCLLLVSGNAFAAIADSAHDFASNTTYQATGTGATEICAYCHTPHKANTAAKPLWNKSTLTSKTYTAYGTTIAGTDLSGNNTISGTTQLCLGCHDGSVAPGTVANPPNSGWTDDGSTILSDNSTYQDTTFANDHPVNFDITTSQATLALAKTAEAFELAGYPMEGDVMTCATCHNVHNESDAETLLVTTNAASAMCQECHGK